MNDTGGTKLAAEQILIASGTRPAHDPEIPFDNQSIIDADHLPGLGQVPREIVIVGAGVVDLEYASFIGGWWVDVVLIDQRSVRIVASLTQSCSSSRIRLDANAIIDG